MTGSPQNSQRAETAPLQRDNFLVDQEHRSASPADFSPDTLGGPGETTRPAFHQPSAQTPHGGQPQVQQAGGQYGQSTPGHGQPQQHQPAAQNQVGQNQAAQNQGHPAAQAGWGGAIQQYAAHHQGQAYAAQQQPYAAAQQQYPQQGYVQQQQGYAQQHVQQGAQQGYGQQQNQQHGAGLNQRGHPSTSRQEPVRPAAPASATGGSGLGGTSITPSGWALRGLVLFGVAVVSGLLWLLIKPADPADEAQDSPTPGPQTQHQFNLELREEGQQGCANVSTRKIKEFFGSHRCEHLTRALYTTSLPDGQRVLTSVVTIRMADSETAAQLNELVTQDGTGNVMDLVSAGRDLPDDFPGLSSDVGYYSEQQDRLVVVGESGYFSQVDDYEDQRLTEVTRDALGLGWPQDSG
ncbi:hypothetical protein [Saccharopolyspora gloriosae]|uniref:hypothetical protein n=1 Tax=Saccharopolyspora gloriosae TaxID=455344 RepID=UPI001FB764F8|nr:hypothetical protein [Saccharopolyspora gloriosae]